jgi:hypothetical protein
MSYPDAIKEIFPGLEYKEMKEVKALIPDIVLDLIQTAVREFRDETWKLEEEIGYFILLGIHASIEEGRQLVEEAGLKPLDISTLIDKLKDINFTDFETSLQELETELKNEGYKTYGLKEFILSSPAFMDLIKRKSKN